MVLLLQTIGACTTVHILNLYSRLCLGLSGVLGSGGERVIYFQGSTEI